MQNHKRRSQAVIGLMLLCIAIATPSAMAQLTPSQPAFSVGSVFIYSDGQVEKLIQKGDGWFTVEDMRKRRYKKDLNFTVPTLEYASLNSNYRQRVNSGNPNALFPLDQSSPSGFSLKKDRPGRRQSIYNWSCNRATPAKIKIMGKKRQVFKTSCTRFKWKKYYDIKEVRDLYYDPKSAWVVKRVTRKKGKKRVRKLIAVLTPEKATAKAITRLLKKHRKQASRNKEQGD